MIIIIRLLATVGEAKFRKKRIKMTESNFLNGSRSLGSNADALLCTYAPR